MTNTLALDTNAAIAVLNGDDSAINKLQASEAWFLPVVVLGELNFGAYRSKRVDQNLDNLSQFSKLCNVVNVNEQTAIHYGRIKAELKRIGSPIPSNDCWIAALCRQHGHPLATMDAHFDKVSG